MTMLLGSVGSSDPISDMYKMIVPKLKNYTDLNYSPASATTYTLSDTFILARNVTIGVNATVKFPVPSGTLYGTKYLICDTLTVNGVLDGIQAGGSGQGTGGPSQGGKGGGGGNGGTGLVIFARSIVGTGTIMANGSNATDPVGSFTVNGQNIDGNSGLILNSAGRTTPFSYGKGGLYTTTIGGSGAIGGNAVVDQLNLGETREILLTIPSWIATVLRYQTGFNGSSAGMNPMSYGICGGGGGAGSTYYSGTNYGYTGAGGGGGIIGAGGAGANDGGTATLMNMGGGGAGGGGGGAIWIFSENPLPAVNVQAMGGAGGKCWSPGAGNTPGCGGGGGGGYIGLWTPDSSSAITNVSGGAGGSGSASSTSLFNVGNAGSAGQVEQMYFVP
jgi:hypothetical protein